MGLSVWQIAIVGILIVLLFGRGKISDLMGDVAQGIKSFKKGIKDDDETDAAKSIDHEPAKTVNATEQEKSSAS